MTAFLRDKMLWAGIALIVGVNVVVLGEIVVNRSGAPDSTLTLSERELERPYRWALTRDENTSLSLRLRYHVPGPRGPDRPTGVYLPDEESLDYGEAKWLDDAHLAALGFDVARLRAAAEANRGGAPRAREAFLVLELGGPAYHDAVARAKRRSAADAELAAANPGREEFAKRAKRAAEAASAAERTASRLYVVDAGLERDPLRAKYPDRSVYAIVRARLQPIAARFPDYAARVEGLAVPEVAVPFALRNVLGQRLLRDATRPGEARPRFEAIVSWGGRFEPWLGALTLH
jgi:hypothetical protein